MLGLPTDLPVNDAFAAWLCSPRRAVDWLLHAAAMDTAQLGLDRGVNPPGISTTIAHLLQALDTVKPGASSLIRRAEDKEIAAIVGLALGALVGAGCRYFDIPLPAPEHLIGVCVLLAITIGFVSADYALPKGETLVRLDNP